MTTCLGKSCLFGLPRMPFVNCCQFMYSILPPFGFECRIWDLIVSVPDHGLSFYFTYNLVQDVCSTIKNCVTVYIIFLYLSLLEKINIPSLSYPILSYPIH